MRRGKKTPPAGPPRLTGRRRKILIGLAGVCALALAVLFTVKAHIVFSTAAQVKSAEAASSAQAILLLGARVYPDGRVSHMVADRIATAVELYRSGKAKKILVSGDHGTKQYDEVNAIRKKLLAAGVPAADVFMDHAGFDTYSSVYRAKAVFQASSLILVTQRFHLGRALFFANRLSLSAQGVAADRRRYRDEAFYEFRELFAAAPAFFNAVLFKPRPKFLGKPIPLTGDGRATND